MKNHHKLFKNSSNIDELFVSSSFWGVELPFDSIYEANFAGLAGLGVVVDRAGGAICRRSDLILSR